MLVFSSDSFTGFIVSQSLLFEIVAEVGKGGGGGGGGVTANYKT